MTATSVTQPVLGTATLDDLVVRTLPIDSSYAPGTREVRGALASLVEPTEVREPKLLAYIPEVAELLGFPAEPSPSLVSILGGNALAPGMVPYAQCYGGHQFGNWAGQLGDGRAITLGEVRTPGGDRYELQLKGAGRTPYSRGADGRAVLRSSLRELVCSEAMHHLGIPTTRALSLVTTGDGVVRDMFYDGNPDREPGAITARVAPSFLRFGSYELPSMRGDNDLLRTLVEFTIKTYFPTLLMPGAAVTPTVIAAWFTEVCRRTAHMIAGWMRVGFVHGVMNTDNMSILGITIDYGPYGWLEPFDLGWTPNTTDAHGKRYCFGAQPTIAYWNLIQLARALLPLGVDEEMLTDGIREYGEVFSTEHRQATLAKLGLPTNSTDAADIALLEKLPEVMTAAGVDTTLFFRRLVDMKIGSNTSADERLAALAESFYAVPADSSGLANFLDKLAERVRSHAEPEEQRRARMNAVNPLYVARNYLAQEAIDAATAGDNARLTQWLAVLRRPYQEQAGAEAFAARRPEWARNRAGCSMLSCSS